ncbi:hypothetical protein RclHR1_05070001, partial [Rhizophagus clarus]
LPNVECGKKPLERRYWKFKDLFEKKGGFTIHDAQEILREEVPEILKTGTFEEEEETDVILRGDDKLIMLHDDLFYDD